MPANAHRHDTNSVFETKAFDIMEVPPKIVKIKQIGKGMIELWVDEALLIEAGRHFPIKGAVPLGQAEIHLN